MLQFGDDPAESQRQASFGAGGLCRIFGPDRDAARAGSVALQESSAIPMLIAADVEGGYLHPACLSKAPTALAVAAANDPELVRGDVSSNGTRGTTRRHQLDVRSRRRYQHGVSQCNRGYAVVRK